MASRMSNVSLPRNHASETPALASALLVGAANPSLIHAKSSSWKVIRGSDDHLDDERNAHPAHKKREKEYLTGAPDPDRPLVS
jgi:hypothetical protein